MFRILSDIHKINLCLKYVYDPDRKRFSATKKGWQNN